MKLSYNWLSTFVDLKGITPEDIHAHLTLHTAEVEESIPLKPYFEKVYAGMLVSVKSHPQSKKLHIGTFDLGKMGKKQIIFGEVHELKKEEIYPLALDGAILRSGIEIKNTEIRGEKSEGMVVDNQELGMKNDGLIRWTDPKLLGRSLPDIEANFSDIIFEIDNKSLTHRPDLWSHLGMARELSGIFGRKMYTGGIHPSKGIEDHVRKAKGSKVSVSIETEKCPRFCALRVSGIQVAPSPLSEQILLENLDIRAISNLVDITNLILTGWGQPMHVFDAQKVEKGFVIRQARQNETIVALDGEEYELSPDDTVVADTQKALSIAGIMGGELSGVSDKTTDVIFECANWNPVSTRHTSTRLGLRSDSSIRYEKSLDSEMCLPALLMATEKTLHASPNAQIASILTDEYPQKNKDMTLFLDPDTVRAHSGILVSDSEIRKKLESIHFGVTEKSGKWSVKVPSWRSTKDISIAEDLTEEVVRLYGFENIAPSLPELPIHPPRVNWLRKMEWQCRDTLSARGFQEILNYSFVPREDTTFTEKKSYVTLENPLSDEQAQLRQTLISNIVQNLESELRTHGELHFFEFGKVYEPSVGEILPQEISHLALLSAEISTDPETENKLFFSLKEEIQNLLSSLVLTVEFRPGKHPLSFAHPSKTADIFIQEEKIGTVAVLHPSKNNIKNASISFVEIDTEIMLSHMRHTTVSYSRLSPFPLVRRDISLVLDQKVLMAEVRQEAFKSSPLLANMELFDEFEDEKKFGAHQKNLSFHLEFSSPDHTLSEKEIDETFSRIAQILEKKFQATLRNESNAPA
ncbi:phenylalanine--tRNA ligase subunit beta [Candidatus Gracilibacteria bacterium]|nr:phenylalanine--tRNA ligase subunit beta [Candidatus Gracilibacteria bacterium]